MSATRLCVFFALLNSAARPTVANAMWQAGRAERRPRLPAINTQALKRADEMEGGAVRLHGDRTRERRFQRCGGGRQRGGG